MELWTLEKLSNWAELNVPTDEWSFRRGVFPGSQLGLWKPSVKNGIIRYSIGKRVAWK